jgi:hypothetical protein
MAGYTLSELDDVQAQWTIRYRNTDFCSVLVSGTVDNAASGK